MKARLTVVAVVLIAFLLSSCSTTVVPRPIISNQSTEQPTAETVLILYDSADEEWGWMGELHATHLANLLGHFALSYTAKDVANYVAGEMATYRATFYLGRYYDNPRLPQTFLSDVMTANKPVVWFKYNIWKLAWDLSYDFVGKFGFGFQELDSSGHLTISYKGETFSKQPDDPEIVLTTIIDNQKAATVATASNGTSVVPYIIKGGNLWYVADTPFDYTTEEDRYLVFCDVLHDMLDINHTPSHRALVRIEDVNSLSNPQQLIAIADYLHSQGIPFAVAVTPLFTDPLNYYNQKAKPIMSCTNSATTSIPLSKSPQVVKALHYMVSKGGTIVMHGYTHQYDSVANPYNGVSTTDFEFYRVIGGAEGMPTYVGPVPEDSPAWAQQRISSGISELEKVKLSTQIFEVPHYAASPVDYRVFASNFPATYHRVLYCQGAFTNGKEAPLGTARDEVSRNLPPTGAADRSLEQFFPYVIQKDVYGQKVLPENLDCIKIESWKGLPTRLPKDIIRTAKKNLAIRDSWASFYFHPFINIEYLKQTVEGIRGLGYTFVAPVPTLK